MTALILLALAGVVASLVAVRAGVKAGRPILIVALVAGVALAGINYWKKSVNSPEKQLLSDEEASGRVLGSLVARDIQSGTILVLRFPASASRSSEITGQRCRGFLHAFKGSSVQLVHAGPNPFESGSNEPGFILFDRERLADEVEKWRQEHKDVAAIVSLLPMEPQLRPAGSAAFYTYFAGRGSPWADEIRNGRTKAVILYRDRVPADAGPSAEGLPAKFMLVTKANLDQALKEQPGF